MHLRLYLSVVQSAVSLFFRCIWN